VLWRAQLPQPLPTPPRAAKQRRKGDRLVIACQEQTYWLVNRPPVSPFWSKGVGVASSSRGQCASHERSLKTSYLKLWEGCTFQGTGG
jgi:hypothetical protein